jgi:hypothetical protein
MDDDQKDVAIIEASALLVTLIFIVLSFYSSNYTQFYTTWQQQCALNPQQCAWPPWLGALSAQVGGLEFLAYLVGFFFVVAALAATMRLFMTDRDWVWAGLRTVESAFFGMGLFGLAFVFFFRALKDLYTLGVLIIITLAVIGGALWWAHHRRDVIEATGGT